MPAGKSKGYRVVAVERWGADPALIYGPSRPVTKDDRAPAGTVTVPCSREEAEAEAKAYKATVPSAVVTVEEVAL